MKIILLPLLLLAACADPQPIFKPVPVDMPVATPCKTTPIEKPDFALAHAAPTDALFSKTRAALVEIDQRRAYETLLESQIKLCQ